MVAVPAVGATRPSSIRRVVVLPAPLGPRKPATVPWSISNSSWSTASTSPKRLVSPLTLIAAMARLLPERVPPTTLRAGAAAVVGLAAGLGRRPGGAGGTGRRPAGGAQGDPPGDHPGGPPDPPGPGVIRPVSYASITSWARSRAWSLARTRLTWVLAVAALTTSCSAISALERPLATRASTSRSRSVSEARAAGVTGLGSGRRGEPAAKGP